MTCLMMSLVKDDVTIWVNEKLNVQYPVQYTILE